MKRNLSFLLSLFLLFSCAKNVTEKTFVVTWLNYDQSVLEIDQDVKEGTLPSYDGDVPTKESDDVYDYSFLGWDKTIEAVKEDITYTATYSSLERKGSISLSHESGFYDEPFFLTMNTSKGFDIYYTFDNSDPDESSTKYVSPIKIEDVSSQPNNYSIKENISSLDVYYPSSLVDKCTLLKVVAINRLTHKKSDIYQYNYFVGYQNKVGYSSLPIITMNINDDDLFDYDKGIYVTGRIYDESPHEGYPETYNANYHQKGRSWERLSNFKYFDENKNFEFEQSIGVRIHGGWSRAFNQKSFNLYARKEYDGNSTFKKAFFHDIHAHSLMLRSGGYRDTSITKLRDSLNMDLSQGETFDSQRSTPVILFLNGEYWGIYQLQERYSDNYVMEHHLDVDKKNILIIKNDEVDEGSSEDFHYYEELQSFFQNNSFSLDEAYEEVSNYIDIDEFASYMSTELYVGNIDWPGNNVRLWKDVSKSTSKWHLMMYDTDDSSVIHSKCHVDVDPFLASSHWKSGPLESSCILGLMLSKLIENESFRNLFKEVFSRIGSNNFSPTRVNEFLNSKQALLRTPMVRSYQRFVNSSYTEDYFDSQVEVIRNFFTNRYNYAMTYLNNHIA